MLPLTLLRYSALYSIFMKLSDHFHRTSKTKRQASPHPNEGTKEHKTFWIFAAQRDLVCDIEQRFKSHYYPSYTRFMCFIEPHYIVIMKIYINFWRFFFLLHPIWVLFVLFFYFYSFSSVCTFRLPHDAALRHHAYHVWFCICWYGNRYHPFVRYTMSDLVCVWYAQTRHTNINTNDSNNINGNCTASSTSNQQNILPSKIAVPINFVSSAAPRPPSPAPPIPTLSSSPPSPVDTAWEGTSSSAKYAIKFTRQPSFDCMVDSSATKAATVLPSVASSTDDVFLPSAQQKHVDIIRSKKISRAQLKGS